jgi:hypothetical protein
MWSVQPITELQAHYEFREFGYFSIYALAIIKRVAGADCAHPLI